MPYFCFFRRNPSLEVNECTCWERQLDSEGRSSELCTYLISGSLTRRHSFCRSQVEPVLQPRHLAYGPKLPAISQQILCFSAILLFGGHVYHVLNTQSYYRSTYQIKIIHAMHKRSKVHGIERLLISPLMQNLNIDAIWQSSNVPKVLDIERNGKIPETISDYIQKLNGLLADSVKNQPIPIGGQRGQSSVKIIDLLLQPQNLMVSN